MVGIMKVSRNITQLVYKYVPMQDFTNGSDIDWSKSIAEIDQQLYMKYGFTKAEVAEMANYYGASDKMQELCDWYDGNEVSA